MKFKKYFDVMLTAAMIAGLSMSVVSCKDDDKDDGGPEEQTETQYEQQQLGWDIITQLSDERTAPDGWENKTFEPTIGTAKDGDPYTRVVMTNDVATAAARYGGLIGLPSTINESTTGYSFSLEGIGSLNYKRGSENEQYLAEVTVDIKQMPHLKKILYQTEQQAGLNASFAGTAYYRFGDVVRDSEGSYWICVRPSFGPEGKGDSHWMCVSRSLSKENLFKYEYKGKSWAVPTGLGSNKEHMQNLAEMLYAMLKPADWLQALVSSQKPAMFHDFSTSRINYHNIYFWQRVCKAWEDKGLFLTLFNESKNSMLEKMSGDGLNLLYNGYSWYTKTSWNCQLFQATFTNGTGKQANMHNATYTKPTKRMENLNVDFGSVSTGINGDFFDNDSKLRVIVRYKTGKQLSSNGTYNVKTSISGCEDIYVYNKYFYTDGYDLNEDPEETAEETAYTTRGYFIIGDVVKDHFGNRWICIQDALYNDASDNKDKKWAYFVSFDANAINMSQNSRHEYNLPSKNLGMQTLFAIETLCHNYNANIDNSNRSPVKMAENIKTHAGVDIYELMGIRDTIFSFQGKAPGHVLCSFASTLYYNQSDELCVLRLIGDYTATQANGGRDWSWHFFDSYSSTLNTQPVVMKLSDLDDMSKISQYNNDRWVMQPWYNVKTNTQKASRGYRTQTLGTDRLSDFFYKSGRSWLNGNVPSNMYDEPIIVYAVKRLLDTGKPVYTFEDGTRFQMVSNMDTIDKDMFGPDWQSGNTVSAVYLQYDYQRFLNEKRYDWGITNPIEY